MDIIYHYPPELTQLLIDTIPLLCRSKKDVVLFFRGAGVDNTILSDISRIVNTDPSKINKYEIARTVLERINRAGESTLRERREILKRVSEFEDFSTCWPADMLKAKGLVSEVRRVINVKDSFTRMKQEADKVRKEKTSEYTKKVENERLRIENIEKVKKNLYSLFSCQNPQERGKKLESVLNELFSANGILIREAFTLVDEDGKGISEQVDGVIELDGEVYLVEMKWTSEPVGKDLISTHLVRVYHRGLARGMFISANNYTEPAISISKEALQKTVFCLITLDEIVFLLEEKKEIKDFLKTKVQCAQLDKNPYKRIVN